MVFDLIDFEYDKPFAEQVELLVGVKQEIIFSATVIRFQHVQETRKVEILFPDSLLFQYLPVVRFHELVEGVERGNDAFILLDAPDIQGHRIGQRHFFRTCRRFVVLFPECEDQCLDTLSFLNVENLIIREKRVERYRVFVRISEIDAVLAAGLLVYQRAKSLIAVPRVDQYHVCALFIILPRQMIHEE